ncbi:MAG: hypothetical protein H0W61_02025 [Bacteroidetes bacterium]|nr:hypothetical protein [Bacteroidota bacterium]
MKKLLFIPLLALAACVNVNKDDNGVEVKVGTDSKIRNNIQLEEHGLKVEQAFLLFEDGTLVPQNNETTVGKKILMRLILGDGFKERDGKVFPGASEVIETNTGEVALNEKDLFASYDSTGVSIKDAKFLTLSAIITKIDKLYDYFVVKFKIWDKNSTNYVSGSFKFYVK